MFDGDINVGNGNDPSEALRNKGWVIVIENARDIENPVKFKAFLKSYEDKFDSNWNETEVYARMDPIMTFQNTKRSISFGFDVPAYDYSEANKNYQKATILFRSLYPSYTDSDDVPTLSDAPIFKVKFANLIQDAETGGPLYGVFKSLSFKPNLEAGFFTQSTAGLLADDRTLIVPKVLEFVCEFNVLHAHPLGYNKTTRKFRTSLPEAFPYNPEEITKQKVSSTGGNKPNSAAKDIQAAKGSGMMSDDPTSSPVVLGSGWGPDDY